MLRADVSVNAYNTCFRIASVVPYYGNTKIPTNGRNFGWYSQTSVYISSRTTR